MATTQLASQPVAIQPMETGMKSTSAFLAPKTAAVSRGSAAAVSVARADMGSRNMVFSPLHTTSSKKRAVCASQFAVSAEVQLPAVSISSRNMDDVISSSAASTPTIVTSPGPRKVGGNDHPSDPYWGDVVPVGELPFVFFLLLAGMFCLRIYVTKQAKTEK